MDKQELLNRAKNPKHIPGIFNYCDRWCERCRFTDRCLCYSMETENGRLHEDGEIDAEALFENAAESIGLAMEILQDMAEEEGIDLESLEDVEEPETDNESPVNFLIYKAGVYVDMVDDWFVDNADMLEQAMEKVQSPPHLTIVRPESDEAGLPEEECLEIIDYYHYQIATKLHRALHGRKDESAVELDRFPKDSDGSAKVALIGMDRSVEAWEGLATRLPEQEKDLRAIVDFLKALRNTTELEFSNARAFVRPGFDEAER